MLDMTDGVDVRSNAPAAEAGAGPSRLQLSLGLGVWSFAFVAALAMKTYQGHASEPFMAAFATALCVVSVAAVRAWRDGPALLPVIADHCN